MYPAAAQAQQEGEGVSQNSADAGTEAGEKVVRVGWYDSLFNQIDQFGRRSGYAYEYQQKIAAYTGWKYEYVEGNWLELIEMLKRGEIDLMSDVSYLEDRAKSMLYPSFPMGTEEYYMMSGSKGGTVSPGSSLCTNASGTLSLHSRWQRY